MDGAMRDRNVQVTGPSCCRPACDTGRTRPARTRTLLLALSALVMLVLLQQPQVAMGMKPRLRYMDYHCDQTLDVYSEILLALKPTHVLPEVRQDVRQNHVTCRVRLRAPPGHRIFLHFLWLRISADQQHHDRVKIYDPSPVKTLLTPKSGLYGKLDRSMDIQDSDGSKITDYRSSQNEIIVEYLGNPTAEHAGFKILLTVFKSPDLNGKCPSDHFKCPVEKDLCMPYSAACDGYYNCGARDAGDETNCDSFDTVTDLMDHYSLVFDILVMMCLPVLLFLAITFSALFCMRRYIRLKISIHAEVPVRYSAANGGRVKLEDNKVLARLYAPPSYEDVVTPSKAAMMVPPPAYSTLSARVKAGEVEVRDSEDEMYHLSPSGRRRLEKHQEDRLQVHEGCHDSLSSLDEKSSPRSGRSRRHGRSPKPYKGSHESHWQLVPGQNFNNGASIRSSDTEDEDERERRNKKKGGKAKRTVPVKRRADDLVAAGQTCTGDGDEGRHLLSTQNNANSPNDPATEAPSPASVSDECLRPSQCHHPSSAYSSRSSPRASRALASLPPPPTYSNISGDDPPKYEPRDTSRSPSPSHTPSKVHGNTIGSKSSPQPNSPVPQKNKGNPAQGPNLPCVVEINPCPSNASIPKSSSSSTEGQAPNTCTASPSPSSSSNTDHELSTHSETESRPPSNTNSRTESNGSLADQCVSLMVKEKAQESAATRLV